MKSKKAINMIEKTAFSNGFLSGRFNGQCGHDVMAVCDVMTAVEYAEQDAEERLTRWNDPKEVLPERNRNVLIKLQYEEDAEPSYTVGYWNGQWFGDILGADAEIIGWREIHE